MAAQFKHVELSLVSPTFDSKLMDALMELNHLRRLRLYGSTRPFLFFQLKEIFHLLESVGSARIEGNRTTVSEYIEQKIERKERSNERFSEIANVEQAMEYIENNIDSGSAISHQFIRELHHLAVNDLDEEGDRTPGSYRTWSVEIAKSSHLPPEPHLVQTYMEELIEFINNDDNQKFDLIKVAIAHHRFAWIHPFGNGNGRVVRLITYALLIKYGFKVKDGQIINPTAVFCNDREKYYEMLSVADDGSPDAMLGWCEYVLTGICDEISKVNKLLDHAYLSKHVLKPAISLGRDRGVINKDEEAVLKVGVDLQLFKSSDVEKVLPKFSPRQRTHMITKLKNNGMICPLKENGREYFVAFNNNYLMRSLIQMLEAEDFIPSINE
ncbi:Fic family protein [Porticoccus sp.]